MQYMPLKSLFYFEVCQTVLTYLPSTKFQSSIEFENIVLSRLWGERSQGRVRGATRRRQPPGSESTHHRLRL